MKTGTSAAIARFRKFPRVLPLLLLAGWLCGSSHANAQPTVTGPSGPLSAGATLTLGVSGAGSPATYQWYKDSRQLLGATNGTFAVTNASVLDSGMYFVVVNSSPSQPFPVAVGNPSLLAWGANTNGQLGNGTTKNVSRPVKVASNVVTASAGDAHSLFITADGTLWAMGANGAGQFGIGTTNDSHTPVNVASNVMAVACGALDSLIVTNGALCVMGSDFDFHLGMVAPCQAGPGVYLSPTLNYYANYYHDPLFKVLGPAAGGIIPCT